MILLSDQIGGRKTGRRATGARRRLADARGARVTDTQNKTIKIIMLLTFPARLEPPKQPASQRCSLNNTQKKHRSGENIVVVVQKRAKPFRKLR